MDPNERLTGIAQMAPASMGGPPMQDPNAGMGMPPEMMGAPPPEMMGGMPPEMMAPEMMGGMPPEMMAPEPQAMQGGESAMLAEAVIERTQGDINAAIAVLDDAKAMLMASADQGNQDPMMANMGGPLYRNNGGDISDMDLLRQMIMANLQGQEGREITDKDYAMMAAMIHGQEGRAISDKDLAFHLKMLEGRRPTATERLGVTKVPQTKADGGYMSQEDATEKLMRYRSS
tara:strand:- start:53 stop:745 length:693 start_codon:yes stop_codon:yes gene_type:complete